MFLATFYTFLKDFRFYLDFRRKSLHRLKKAISYPLDLVQEIVSGRSLL